MKTFIISMNINVNKLEQQQLLDEITALNEKQQSRVPLMNALRRLLFMYRWY